MKKLVIAGSAKLHERALYWRGYFEGRGYEVIDWPCPISTEPETVDEPQTAPGLSLGRWLSSSDDDYAERLTKVYQRFYKNIDQADVFFLMNEDQNGIEGYIGASSIAEITYAIINNLNRGHKTEINILKMPAKTQNCYEEVKFWLDQKWVNLYQRPTGKKATIPVSDSADSAKPAATDAATDVSSDDLPAPTEKAPALPVRVPVPTPVAVPEPKPRSGLFSRPNRTIDILTYSKKSLKFLTPEVRAYFKVLCPDFPYWLVKYIAAPEMQRLKNVGMTCGLDYTAFYNFSLFHSVLQHSIGVALITWNFTHDKKQTLSALFHDIASPAFKHCIDFMNGDSESQESTEDRTASIIRDSRSITRLLKKDGILASEVSDPHLYPIADNEIPALSADRLEYTLSNGLFLYDAFDLAKVQEFYSDLAVLTNENGLDELGFKTKSIAQDFVKSSLPLFAVYQSDISRASMQFIADILSSMILSGNLTTDDLYIMSEREIIDWILSCGDKTLNEAFRNYQRATSVYSGSTAKKNTYCISTKPKLRYISPLVAVPHADETTSSSTPLLPAADQIPAERLTKLSRSAKTLIDDFLDEKPAKYVGFDFEFKPYTE